MLSYDVTMSLSRVWSNDVTVLAIFSVYEAIVLLLCYIIVLKFELCGGYNLVNMKRAKTDVFCDWS